MALENKTPVYLSDQEAQFFITLRETNFFELDGEIVIYKEIGSGIIRYIKKIFRSKEKEVLIYQRKKTSEENSPLT